MSGAADSKERKESKVEVAKREGRYLRGTIAESLATKCRGRSWIIVTSQDGLDEIVGEMNEEQRKHILREQLKKIQEELGVKDEKTAEIETLRARISEANLPPEAEKAAQKEVDRLSMMNPAAPETTHRIFLSVLTGLPSWS